MCNAKPEMVSEQWINPRWFAPGGRFSTIDFGLALVTALCRHLQCDIDFFHVYDASSLAPTSSYKACGKQAEITMPLDNLIEVGFFKKIIFLLFAYEMPEPHRNVG